MTKEIISARIRIKNINNITLAEINTYGELVNNNEIRIDGRIFKAGRKTGFGKTSTIYEHANGQFHKVIIDRIEKIA